MDDLISEKQKILDLIRTGAISGVLAIIVYVSMILIPMPDIIGTVLASAFGPLFLIASIGLYYLLGLRRSTASLELARVFNIIAGATVTAMLIVQMSVNAAVQNFIDKGGVLDPTLKITWRLIDHVQLGLDIAWDIFGVIGTILFAINMLKHPRFGKIFGVIGIIVTLILLVLNLRTFPVPPANSGSIDFGPAVGLWYFAVSIQALRSIGWARAQLSQ